MSKLVNFALYQAGWFCCVLGAAHERPWLGTAVAGALLLLHLALLPRRLGELKLLLAAGLVGGLVDSLQSCAGLLVFRSGHVLGCLAPPWILMMWVQFAVLGLVWAGALPLLLRLAVRWTEPGSAGLYRGFGPTRAW